MDTDPTPPPIPAGTLDALLGVELKEATADRVVAVVPVTPRLYQVFGIVHGGVYAAVAETTASFGAHLVLARGKGAASMATPDRPEVGARVVGISNHTEFLRAVRDGELRVEATPVTRGRTTQLWRVEITDGAGRLAAHSSVRLMNLEGAN
jgi:1,4-dihydroxy-2-naphthoyl-CoA hydrolase